MQIALLTLFAVLLAGCSYSDARTQIEIHNTQAKLGTHRFAVAIEYRLIENPTGLLNRFPNGGAPKVLEREARVYMIDVDAQTIDLVARIPDFAGIPQAKSVWIQGWEHGSLYFTLFGYGGESDTGDDLSDERRLIYRIDPGEDFHQIDVLPERLDYERQTGPLPLPPFLRLSKGNRKIDIGIDGTAHDAERRARIILDPNTAEPRLTFLGIE